MAVVAMVVALGVMAGFAPSASAHTGDLHGTYTCQDDGTYLATYTLTLSRVPNNKVGNFWWRIGTTNFQGTPRNHDGMNYWGTKAGNGIITLGTQSLPGNTTTPPWVYAWGEWQGATNGSDGRADRLEGNCRPKDACPELSGNQPPGTVCTPPDDNVEHRTLTTTPTCVDRTVTTTEQERHQSYIWDGDSFEPGPWGPWVTTNETTSTVPVENCDREVRTHVKVTDHCNCYRDHVKMSYNPDKVKVQKSHPSRLVWKFKVTGKFVNGHQFVLPSKIGGNSGWDVSQIYTVKTTNKVCPCKKRGDCHQVHPGYVPPVEPCRTTKNGHC